MKMPCILWIAADGLHRGVDVPSESFLGLHLQLCEFAAGTAARATRVQTDDVC